MMINEIIADILNIKSETIKVSKIGELTDEFRSGRNPSELLELIELDDKNVLNIALYILGEINILCDDTLQKIIKRLFVLSAHEDSQIRYKILISLASLAKEINANTLNDIYKKMSQDSDEDIRDTAKELLQSGNLKFYCG